MLFGLFMLWWGWIGFNCGSTFGITNDKWIVAARAGVITLNTASAGGLTAMIYSRYRSGGKHIHPGDVVNGILGALVTSSPTCATTHTWDPLIFGALGSLFTNFINDTVMKKWLQLDDPVGAVGVHLGGGMWGCIAVGLFADKNLTGAGIDVSGLFRGGGFELMGRQLIGIVAISGWSMLTMPPFFYLVGVLFSRDWKDPRKGLRHEFVQMDRHIHGCTEDPTDLITVEIQKALELRDSLMVSHRRTEQGMLTGIRISNVRQIHTHNLNIPSGNDDDLDATASPDSASNTSQEETI